VNKKELISLIADKSQLTITQAEAALSATFSTIQTAMQEGGVAIGGFGSFSTKIREERKGRNPATGKEMLIPKTTIPVFKAGAQLKEFVKSGKGE